jgi:hypothetical protein
MRGRGVIAGVLAGCGAVALSGPAHADQYDFISALNGNGELRVDARHDRYRQGALSRSAERGDATGGARQSCTRRDSRQPSQTIILISAVNNMCSDTKPAVVGRARDNGYTGPV